ncbi:OLC1v1033442C1 [Oldenlandia corymbosa var. corymbosa]|uniref:Katanin p80 WD40 repeat-containing subunit B1 homolog n=1 Tax=Oldenlandia corymbosa var. corymbosa TaxID=529605 RepID=A0AAV1CN73_OLDCO|nr:OLC1v1033442C1 [Oldenlandia corymbosa var. corymbosa]
MTTTKRAYKLQEFVAHSESVNCLKIGRKSSRVLVTGGEDHKVNLWAIGKPNAILSLSGHSSGIDSVGFDSSEVLVAAGAASGTIKLWDLEEAKIVRTLTGHRSNCISLDFHPFGEFFASGSLDTNLKIWDIRRKGCIHTYKGHTRGVNAIRFTPDGRWVVSGGEDNTVKLWDLTAGKLLHDFKCHDGQIQCIDFHPHEFLLATGSSDKTVKFWDLETFELIGSSGPETTGVRCMTFNPDGKTLLCGLHESLKVYSWEPILCHDTVDVGWSKLSDLNIHEGKLLGCSYNQSCVGVWVVDISRIEPYAMGSTTRLNGQSESKTNMSGNLSVPSEDVVKASLGRLSISQNSDPVREIKSSSRLSTSQNSDLTAGSVPGTPQRVNLSNGPKVAPVSSAVVMNTSTTKKNPVKVQSVTNASIFQRSDVIPIVVPRNSLRFDHAAESRKEGIIGRTMPLSLQSKGSDSRISSNNRDDSERSIGPSRPEIEVPKVTELGTVAERNSIAVDETRIPNSISRESNVVDGKRGDEIRVSNVNRESSVTDGKRAGRTRSIVANWERKDRISFNDGLASSDIPVTIHVPKTQPPSMRSQPVYAEKEEAVCTSEEDVIDALMKNHDQFLGSMHSRFVKLQMIRSHWQRHDIKGALSTMEKLGDHGVIADMMSLMTEKIDIVTLDICTSLLPLLNVLLESNMDRHQNISLDMLLKLVRLFGSLIYSSLSASSSVGVDIVAEQRLERCNICFIELEKVKRSLPSLCRRGGSVAKSAHELNLALQDVS